MVGLFSGGTLCAEAQIIFWGGGEAVVSNAPVPNAGPIASTGHRFLDLGSDAYTKGRPHPMIDPGVRDTPLAAGLRDCRRPKLLVTPVRGFFWLSKLQTGVAEHLWTAAKSPVSLWITLWIKL